MKKQLLLMALWMLCGLSYAQLTITSTVQPVTCAGGANGSATLSVSGGSPAYSFTWTPGSQHTAIVNGLSAGVYTVAVRDNSGTFGYAVVTVSQSASLTVVASQTNISCGGACDGKFSISASGGVLPYSYVTNFGGVTAYNQNLCAGNYTYTVADGGGCVVSKTLTLTQPAQITGVLSATNTTCGGPCSGAASLALTGGVLPYTYTWTPGGPGTYSVNGLCAGNASVTATDANGCTYGNSVNILQSSAMTVSVNVTNPSCALLCNGSATASASGSAIGPFSYNWVFANGQTFNTQQIQNICSGNYTLTVTDGNSCARTVTGTITAPVNAIPNATISAVLYNESCHLTGDGGIDLSVTGANPGPFTYQWSNGATTQDLASLTSGSYSVIVTDAGLSCTSYSGTVSAAGSNCGTVSGNVFIDLNLDCTKNGNDFNCQNMIVTVNPGNRLGYTDLAGNYAINNLPYGTYTITPAAGSFSTSCTPSITTVVSVANPNSVNNHFPLRITNAWPDVYVSINTMFVIPGFSTTAYYYVKNHNANSTSGQLKAIFPTPLVPSITGISPATYTLSGDTVIWNYSNLSMSSALVNYYIAFTPPVNTPLGSTFTTCVTATTTGPDLVPPNNTTCYSHIVTGSFDPNDKTVSPVGMGPEGNITVNDMELNYLIRFQNTGNGPAVNIVVKDTLSPFVDVMSLEMLSVSHNYKVDILPGNILRWKFDNIQLPDSNSNEPGSHGYIHYRIRQKANNPLGTEIKNTAYIYFDFNDPVITNTALNTLWAPTVGMEDLNKAGDTWLVYPNPATTVLYVRNGSAKAEAATRLELINAMGQVLHTESFTGFSKSIDLGSYASGVYFVKLISDQQSTIKRIVISR